MDRNKAKQDFPIKIEMSDDDIYEAMKDMRGYLDITPADVRELYRLAYHHAFERIACSVRAQDVMTAPVISVRKETPLKDVAHIMAKYGISGVPVVEEDMTVRGVISEKDFLFRMGDEGTRSFMSLLAACMEGKEGCPADPIRAERAEDIMTAPVITAGVRASLRSLYDPSKPAPVDPRSKVGGWLAWSSEVDDADPSYAWYFNFYGGGEYKYTRYPFCNEYFYVLAVRSRR